MGNYNIIIKTEKGVEETLTRENSSEEEVAETILDICGGKNPNYPGATFTSIRIEQSAIQGVDLLKFLGKYRKAS